MLTRCNIMHHEFHINCTHSVCCGHINLHFLTSHTASLCLSCDWSPWEICSGVDGYILIGRFHTIVSMFNVAGPCHMFPFSISVAGSSCISCALLVTNSKCSLHCNVTVHRAHYCQCDHMLQLSKPFISQETWNSCGCHCISHLILKKHLKKCTFKGQIIRENIKALLLHLCHKFLYTWCWYYW